MLLLLFVSLIVIGAAVILLAARMIVLRRDGELAMLRARGGSLGQVAAVMGRGALVAALPAAVIGAGAGHRRDPGGRGVARGSAGRWPGRGRGRAGRAAAGRGLAAPQARPGRQSGPDHRPPRPAGARTAWRRPVAEVTACAAAVAALVVLHDQGQPAGGQVNLLVTAAPVLVAIPVVVVMLRLYPLAVRGLLALSARGAGATGFVALSRAARSSLTGVLPAFALVLALSLATFAGMVGDGITRGETTDVLGHHRGRRADPARPHLRPRHARRAEGDRGGPRRASRHRGLEHHLGYAVRAAGDGGRRGPGQLRGRGREHPVPVLLRRPGSARCRRSAAAVPVLASPAAAALLGRGTAQLTSLSPAGPVTVRVAGILDSTPAQPGGGAFVVMALQALSGPGGQPAPNMVLVAGSAIDDSRLSAVVNSLITGSTITFRASVLAALTGSPLQHGAALIVVLTLAEAAALGLFIVLLGLALGSAERELTLARLTVMGHERDTRLVMAEAMPAVLAAVVAGAVCAVVLPHLIGSSIDLSAFTGTSAPVQFQPDATALGLPAAAVVVLAVAALAAEARTLRRRGIAGILRAN